MTGELMALGAALVWSLSVVLFKRSDSLTPQGMNLFKNLVAALLLALTMVVLGQSVESQRTTEDWARIVASGVLGIAVADTLAFMALKRLGASMFAVVECVYAPTIVGLSVAFLAEPIGVSFLIGAVLVVGGVAVASGHSEGDEGPRGLARRDLAVGVACGVTGIVAMGVGVILVKPALERSSLVEVTWLRILAGIAAQGFVIALVPGQRRALEALKPRPEWKTLLPASILGSYIAMLLWLGGYKWAQASTAAVLNQLSTISTIAFAWVLLGEAMTKRRVAGGVLAAAGAIIVVLQP